MLRLEQIKLPIDTDKRKEPWQPPMAALKKKAADILRIKPAEIRELRLVRHAVDARNKPRLSDVCAVDVLVSAETEKRLLAAAASRGRVRGVSPAPLFLLRAEPGKERMKNRPVVVGAGPAGLFCALALAQAGYRPVLLERGDGIAARDAAVRRFWESGTLDPESNIQFGLGGAGAYSDGKLTTGVRDREGYGMRILHTMAAMGAPADILYESHPHIGTDGLKRVVGQIREAIEAQGGEVRLRTRLTGLSFDGRSGRLTGAETTGGELPAQALVLAPGHSARDTFAMLQRAGVVMEQKAFAVGLRVAHAQEMIDRAQYGVSAAGALPPAIYKLTAKSEGGRGVYSFCMCPGGRILNASSEEGLLCVNGMSARARDGRYANSAIVVTVTPEDYRREGRALEGMDFQRMLEQRAFRAGDGQIPISFWQDFARSADPAGKRSAAFADFDPGACFCGGTRFADLTGLLPAACHAAILSAMPVFGRQLKGFDSPGTILAGVESRTSSPVRILRGESGEAEEHAGLYPCGEGVGYAGGIMSAAMDGLRTAERIIGRFALPESGE